jgi:antitoxin component of MazEF toxin-antitoxin module
MEFRKVQRTGGSSYVISLPKEWVQSMNIKKNEPLPIKIQADGSLLILPRPSEEKEPRTKEFNADTIENPTFLFGASWARISPDTRPSGYLPPQNSRLQPAKPSGTSVQ